MNQHQSGRPAIRNTDLGHIDPLRLMGGAFAFYQQLKEEEKEDFSLIKSVLYIAFAMDCFMAYEQFTEWCLLSGELVDIYLRWSYQGSQFYLME